MPRRKQSTVTNWTENRARGTGGGKRRRMARENRAWAAKAGPVTVRYVDPKPSSKSTEDGDAV